MDRAKLTLFELTDFRARLELSSPPIEFPDVRVEAHQLIVKPATDSDSAGHRRLIPAPGLEGVDGVCRLATQPHEGLAFDLLPHGAGIHKGHSAGEPHAPQP